MLFAQYVKYKGIIHILSKNVNTIAVNIENNESEDLFLGNIDKPSVKQ